MNRKEYRALRVQVAKFLATGNRHFDFFKFEEAVTRLKELEEMFPDIDVELKVCFSARGKYTPGNLQIYLGGSTSMRLRMPIHGVWYPSHEGLRNAGKLPQTRRLP